MQTIFNNLTNISTGISSYPDWKYLRSGLNRNLKTTIDYYQNRRFAVKGNHLIARILTSISVSFDRDIEQLYNLIEAKALHVGMHFKLSSSVYKGDIFNGVFYGEGTKEIIMVTNDFVNPYEIEKDWKNVQAVKVVTHPKSDLSLLLPNGKAYSDEGGLACIEINLPALVVQYRCFVKEQYERIKDSLTASPTSVFLHMYVLPNMLYSHLDHCIFNRVFNLAMGAPMGQPQFRHPFTLIDYDKKVDNCLEEVVDYVKQTDLDFNTILRTFPCVTKMNFKELLRLPEQAPTRQIAGSEFLARLKAIDFLININPNNGKTKNADTINYINRLIKRNERDSILDQVLSSTDFESVRTQLMLLSMKIK